MAGAPSTPRPQFPTIMNQFTFTPTQYNTIIMHCLRADEPTVLNSAMAGRGLPALTPRMKRNCPAAGRSERSLFIEQVSRDWTGLPLFMTAYPPTLARRRSVSSGSREQHALVTTDSTSSDVSSTADGAAAYDIALGTRHTDRDDRPSETPARNTLCRSDLSRQATSVRLTSRGPLGPVGPLGPLGPLAATFRDGK
ncbi:hypothetical protein KGM_209438 [Danaus plexippus plexippus]|uniref:Uncharacterized protein n=1 Tax=Danaus plexippus plexippus TaxID=278856 RepID=A0A212F697_DANPL|nr:hypothetical protein KGM_209438 [Danaus plexippus plexippus]